jgi:Double-stranded DNA deaminase toxin A
MAWTSLQQKAIDDARRFFVGHTEAVGMMTVAGAPPMFIKSGIDGGPWGGTQRGGVPRMPGWAFTKGGPSQGNIATHVEGHAVAIMWQRRLSNAVLLVDRPMCNVCNRNLPSTLPPGATLLVISRDEGETQIWASHGA